MKIAIIGAGLAGLSCYYFLNRYVSKIKIYEQGDAIAAAASGNPVGTVNPRFTAFRNPQSDFYTSAFGDAISLFDRHAETLEWNKCGALHLMNDEKKQKRFEQTAEHWGWPDELLRLVEPWEASKIAGVEVSQAALYLSQSGVISPTKLCDFYGRGADIEFNASIENLDDIDADVIILASGQGLRDLPETKDLPLGHVRGQITQARQSEKSDKLQCNIHYGGYCSVAQDGVHTVGASFQRWLEHSDIIPQDDADNLKKLGAVLPEIAEGLEICGHRASVRTTASDHFPVVGNLPEYDNVYISSAHGSHGIVSSFGAARLLADMILDRPRCLSKESINALAPARFF